ncbi:hypothetical protein GCM10029964_050800 [Kibdelosporangium lantanae]
MTPGFTATVTTPDAHTVTVHLSGELTFENAEDLDRLTVEQLRDQPELRELVLDCGDLAAIDSMGLSMLLMVKRRAEQANAHLRLDNRPPNWNACSR